MLMTIPNRWIRTLTNALAVAACAALIAENAHAQLVPGTGRKVLEVGDDLEDPDWSYTFNLPKSSTNLDRQTRWPTGTSSNERWFESAYRGQPDVIKRVPTPPKGIPGSRGALLLQSRATGIPGSLTHKMQQDDFMLNISGRIGHVPVSWQPSCVVRVYLPPFEEWENRTGSHFGMRADVVGESWQKPKRGLFGGFRRQKTKIEPYWPGFFIQFNSKDDPQHDTDSAVLIIRSDESGHDFMGPQISEPGWWTLGMSFTRDGRVHYYAKPGVSKLRAQDHIASMMPYSSTAKQFHTFYFNVVNFDNGKSWSTKWIIDDPTLYYVR